MDPSSFVQGLFIGNSDTKLYIAMSFAQFDLDSVKKNPR